MATECKYSQEYISSLLYLDVLKMADYWMLEPPMSVLFKALHFKDAADEQPSGFSPNVPIGNYYQVAKPLQDVIRTTWLKRNPGKTERDFFEALKKRALETINKSKANDGK